MLGNFRLDVIGYRGTRSDFSHAQRSSSSTICKWQHVTRQHHWIDIRPHNTTKKGKSSRRAQLGGTGRGLATAAHIAFLGQNARSGAKSVVIISPGSPHYERLNMPTQPSLARGNYGRRGCVVFAKQAAWYGPCKRREADTVCVQVLIGHV